MPGSGVFVQIEVARGRARATVDGAHAHRLCAGHFPGDPIIPGAYLAALMAELGAAALGRRAARLAALERCAFRRPVRPEDPIVVTARRLHRTCVEAEVLTNGRLAARASLRYRAP